MNKKWIAALLVADETKVIQNAWLRKQVWGTPVVKSFAGEVESYLDVPRWPARWIAVEVGYRWK